MNKAEKTMVRPRGRTASKYTATAFDAFKLATEQQIVIIYKDKNNELEQVNFIFLFFHPPKSINFLAWLNTSILLT